MTDKQLDHMLAFLRRPQLASGEAVVVWSGSESVDGIRDDGSTADPDGLGTRLPGVDTALRIREGAITLPVVDATVTAVHTDDAGTATTTSYKVRDVQKDRNNPGMWLILAARA